MHKELFWPVKHQNGHPLIQYYNDDGYNDNNNCSFQCRWLHLPQPDTCLVTASAGDTNRRILGPFLHLVPLRVCPTLHDIVVPTQTLQLPIGHVIHDPHLVGPAHRPILNVFL